jgi:hypothetical protein
VILQAVEKVVERNPDQAKVSLSKINQLISDGMAPVWSAILNISDPPTTSSSSSSKNSSRQTQRILHEAYQLLLRLAMIEVLKRQCHEMVIEMSPWSSSLGPN